MDEDTKTIVIRQRPSIDGKTLLIGGGIIGLLIWFFFFRGGGGGGVRPDRNPLLFKLRSDGLWLGSQKMSIPDAIARVIAGGRRDALVTIAGDTRQGDVDAMDVAFQQAGITLRSHTPQSIASVYQRGRGYA